MSNVPRTCHEEGVGWDGLTQGGDVSFSWQSKGLLRLGRTLRNRHRVCIDFGESVRCN